MIPSVNIYFAVQPLNYMNNWHFSFFVTWDQLEPNWTNQEPFKAIQVDSDQSEPILTKFSTNLDKGRLIWFNLDHSGHIFTKHDLFFINRGKVEQ